MLQDLLSQTNAELVLLLNMVESFISTWPKWSCENDLYTSIHINSGFQAPKWAHRWGWPLNIFAWCIGSGGHTYAWVMSHIWMSRVTHKDESCHTYEWVISHIWVHHVTHMCKYTDFSAVWIGGDKAAHESCHPNESVMSHIWRSRVWHRNESRLTYEWVMSHI